MTRSEYLSVLNLMAEYGLTNQPIKVYTTTGNDLTGYVVADPLDEVVYFSSQPQPAQKPFEPLAPPIDPPGQGGTDLTYYCVALAAIAHKHNTSVKPDQNKAVTNTMPRLYLIDYVTSVCISYLVPCTNTCRAILIHSRPCHARIHQP
jgi:hypothetical protein